MPDFHDSLKYLVKRDGISQKQRKPASLDPSEIKLDERKLEDFLVFALEYAKKVKFFNLNNSPEGTWEGFWSSDPTMVIAAITKTNPLPSKLAFEKVAAATPNVRGLEKSINNILDVAKKIEYWFNSIRRGTSLHIEIRRLIMANFQGILHELATLEKSADTYIDGYRGYDDKKYSGFSPEWKIDLAKNLPNANLNLLIPEPEIGAKNDLRCSNNLTEAQKLSAAYAILKKYFTTIYNVYFQIVQLSPTHLEQSLTRKDHPPHIALFISFLKLFLLVQDHLNQMTKKHLDFFYSNVLGLKPKDAVPDKAHLFFELAKNRLEHSLDGGVRFRADKDVEGNDLFYALDKTSVFNLAKVESLKTLYLNKSDENSGLNAAPIANSEDGLGTPIQDDEVPTWLTMGSANMPVATIGFAVASWELLLREGLRTITLNVLTDNNVTVDNDIFHVYLSGESEWIPVPISASSLEADSKGFKVKCTLGAESPPILPFDSEEFEEELGTNLPVLKILINPKRHKNPKIFQELQALRIKGISLKVEVENLTQIMAFNDEGSLDTGKPFFPFTSIPKKGSSFYIGSKEVFQKNLGKLKVKINWENRPENFDNYYAGYEIGNDSVENDNTDVENTNGSGLKVTFQIAASLIGEREGNQTCFLKNECGEILNENDCEGNPIEATILDTDYECFYLMLKENSQISQLTRSIKVEDYGIRNKNGFLRLDLLNDFGHSQYRQVLTRQMLAVARHPDIVKGAYYWKNNQRIPKKLTTSATTTKEVVIPNPPFTPSIKSITIGYESNSSINENTKNGHIEFIHLHPFENTYEHIKKINDSNLFPQFNISTSITEINELIPQAGALLIGIKNLQPKQSLSLLFQLVENTANAELSKPKVYWHYLKSNEWKPFRESQIISDTTDELLRAGIVEFAIPHDINKENTILPSDLHWIKAAVTKNPQAISHAIDIHAQAAQVTFENNENDLTHLKQPLPAETISKLENDDAGIKGISQLYDSYGGRPAESNLSFYTRVSEHLRHKGRAITLFDYERIILEEFPAIYKVRCVNHTRHTKKPTNKTFHLCPGHVVISVVPDFSKLKAVDRRQPKVSLAQLEKIRRFLEDRNCAFVGADPSATTDERHSLHVLNPIYEDIKIGFKVRFLPEITAIEFHIEQLKNALVRFLSPWAFEDSSDITFGGKVFKSVILHFVEKQPYVDYVKDFKLYHENSSEDTNMIMAKTPISILVPTKEDDMDIQPIYDEVCVSGSRKQKSGLGYQTLGNTDFTL
jgi:hypothetical protein